jgi:IclR family pca regulon transcriptional regulator
VSDYPDGARTDYVQSLARGLSVLKSFNADNQAQTLSDVARATDLTRAAARRFLLTLAHLGYVRTDGKNFSLTPRVLELGFAYLSSQPFTEIARPHMAALVAEIGESVSASVLDDDDIVYIVRVPVSRIMTVAINIGTRFPAYCTSMGRVLLAHLPADELDAYFERVVLEERTAHTMTSKAGLRDELVKIRGSGWAVVDQELEDGLRSLAVPLRDRNGTVFAALNVSTPAHRRTLEAARREFLPTLLATAARIEGDLSSSQTF